MSEIASKPNTGASSSLVQPLNKKATASEHDLLFAALFGGVVTSETDESPSEVQLTPTGLVSDGDGDGDGDNDDDDDAFCLLTC